MKKIVSYKKSLQSCFTIDQLDTHRVRDSSISDKSNHKIDLVLEVLRYCATGFAHFEKFYYRKSSFPETLLKQPSEPYSLNYKRKPAEGNFLNFRCRLTVQNSFFKLRRLCHWSFLQNSFKFWIFFWIKPQSEFLEFPSLKVYDGVNF